MRNTLSKVLAYCFCMGVLQVSICSAQNAYQDTASWEQGLHLGFNAGIGKASYFSEIDQKWNEAPSSGIPGFQIRFYSQKKIRKAWFWQWEFGLFTFGRSIEQRIERPLPSLYYIGLQSNLLVGKRLFTDNIRLLAGPTAFYSLTDSGDRRFLYGTQIGAGCALPYTGIIFDIRCVVPSFSDLIKNTFVRYQPIVILVSFAIPFNAGEYRDAQGVE